MFDVQNCVSFTNSRLATKNFIDYVLLVQFSRFISLLFNFNNFYSIIFFILVVNSFFRSFSTPLKSNNSYIISLYDFIVNIFFNVFLNPFRFLVVLTTSNNLS